MTQVDQELQKKVWTLPESFQYCKRVATSHYENFPVGSKLIPKKIRPYFFVLYAFARRADDFADEKSFANNRLDYLEDWREMLFKCVERRVNHPVFLALGETIKTFKIPIELLDDLLSAFKMDVKIKRHPKFENLLFYCKHSANPVGRLVLYLFGKTDPDYFKLSDYICTALQLANFWQDVAVDLDKGRIYIPQEDFEKFEYPEVDLLARKCTPQFQKLLAFQVQRTKKLFRMGSALPEKVGGRLGMELRCVILGGMKILEAIENIEYNTIEQRPTLSKKDKFKIIWHSFFFFKSKIAPKKQKEKLAESA